MLTTTPAARATSHNKPASRFRDYASADFDRDACPIIARHFFGSPPCSEEHGVSKAFDEAGNLGEVEIPDNLRTEAEDRLSENTAATWDSIVRDIAEQKFEDDDAGDDE